MNKNNWTSERCRAEITRTLEIFMDPNSIVEIRALDVAKGNGNYSSTWSGYFDKIPRLVEEVQKNLPPTKGVYFTPNPPKRDLLARSSNRIKGAENTSTTKDHEIEKRSWLLIDFDPVRPSGISSTDKEHQAALDLAYYVRAELKKEGWPNHILADSGNGAHLCYKVDLLNNEESTTLIKKCLQSLAKQFDTEKVKIDTATFNAARIWKLYGTKARKGDDTLERPHRYAQILEVPEHILPVPIGWLEKLAGELQEDLNASQSNQRDFTGKTYLSTVEQTSFSRGSFDLQDWINTYLEPNGIKAKSPENYQGGLRWQLFPCPFDSNHSKGEVALFQLPNGAIVFKCFHNSCSNYKWKDLRRKFEANNSNYGYYVSTNKNWEEKLDELPFRKHPAPTPISSKALYGLAGDITKLIEKSSEADIAALLVQTLVAFGSIIGRTGRTTAANTDHFCNLFACLVGRTGSGRKSSSWSPICSLFEKVDPTWANRVASGLSSGEGLIFNVRDQTEKKEPIKESGKVVKYQQVIEDEGVTDKRLLVIESEFASVLRTAQRDGNTLSPVVRDAWDKGSLQTLTKNSPTKATGAHISIIGNITPMEVRQYINRTELANGLANRFLWVWTQRSKLLPDGADLDILSLNPMVKGLRQAFDFAKEVGILRRDTQARVLWHQEYPKLTGNRTGLFGGVTSRAEAQVLRLSCIYALLDLSPTIKLPHLEAALAVWTYCEESARFIFGDSLGDQLADEILEALREEPNGMTRSEISEFLGRNHSSLKINSALTNLIEAGLANYNKERSKRGRPIERWFAAATATVNNVLADEFLGGLEIKQINVEDDMIYEDDIPFDLF